MKSFQSAPIAAIALATLCLPLGSHAQQVYRCGNNYSQTPCAGGTVIQADDSRTDAQRAAAKETLSREKALGKELEASRRKDEAQVLAQEKLHLAAQAKADAKAQREAHKRQQDQLRKEKQASKSHAGKQSRTAQEPGVFEAAVPTSGKPKKSK